MADDRNSRPQVALPDREKRAWLRLLRSENVGPGTFYRLINRYGGAAAALEALPDLAARGGAKRPPRIATNDDIDAEWLAGSDLGAELIARGDPSYPSLLACIPGAPPLIWARGETAVLSRPAIAIVGSRNASATGRKLAREFAAALGEAGFVVVSGFARGIDTAAHEASLKTGTVGVFAGGIGTIYPPENAELAEHVAKSGALITERSPFAEPRGRDFPARNRIISGLSYGVFVVEAAYRSGTLITARYALEQGRDVFAAPGNLADPRAGGTNKLIKDGAIMVTEPDDILDAVKPMLTAPRERSAVHERDARFHDGLDIDDTVVTEPPPKGLVETLVSLIGVSDTPVDLLIRESGASPGAVQAALMELELAGRIARADQQGIRIKDS